MLLPGRASVDAHVWPGRVVEAKVMFQGRSAIRACSVGLGVGPFGEECADEAFGFAIRPRRVRPRAPVPNAVRRERGGALMRAIGAAIVRHHARDLDAALREVPNGAAQEADGTLLGFIREDFRVGEPGAIVNGHMEHLPSQAARAPRAVAMNPMPDDPDFPELFHVEMQEVARGRPLVAIRRPGRIQPLQAVEAESPLLPHHGGQRELEVPRDAGRAVTLPAPSFDPPPHMAGQPRRGMVRSTGAIDQSRLAFGGVAVPPFPDGLPGHAELHGELRVVRVREPRSADQLDSLGIGQACIRMGVHRSSGGCRLSVSTTPACNRYDL